jgi:GTPase SAR1 family protein
MNNNHQLSKLLSLIDRLEQKKQTQSSEPTDIRIGLWGTSGSGKTTYLAILYKALTHKDSNWFVRVDKPAREFVMNNLNYIQTGNFPPATEAADKLNIFTYTLSPKSFKGNGCKTVLNFIDAPGGFYENILGTTVQIVDPQNQRTNAGMQLNQNQNNSMGILDYLLSCDGIIFLLDPVRSKEEGTLYWTLLLDLFLEFQERSPQPDMNNGQLQQYIAFCVTKVDKKKIWNQGKKSADLAKNVMGNDLFDRLPNFCLDGRYEFFSVASIGRYKDEDGKWKEAVIYPKTTDSSNTFEPQAPPSSPNNDYEGGYDPDDALGGYDPDETSENPNTSDDEWDDAFPSTPESPPTPKPTINRDVGYESFNVIEPVEWLIESIQKKPPSRPQRQ